MINLETKFMQAYTKSGSCRARIGQTHVDDYFDGLGTSIYHINGKYNGTLWRDQRLLSF